jgi:hypothetical protein
VADQVLCLKGESTGIISNAIANAEKLPPHHGQENISLLQQSSTKRSPATTQFTFTCESAPGGLTWPGSDRNRLNTMPQQSATSPTAPGKENWPRAPPATPGQNSATTPPSADLSATKDAHSRNGVAGSAAGPETPHATPPRKSTRRRSKSYLAMAEERRRATQLYNKRHPPKPEDIWICHFCEYEWIFGHPPEALVRAYEIKERKQKQLEEQRRAQWERMKKGKHKGKKNSKLPGKNSHAGGAQDLHHHADSRGVAGDHYAHSGQGDEYYDDEDEYYEDEEYEVDEDEIVENEQIHPHHDPHHRHHSQHHSRGSDSFSGASVGHDGGGT